MSGTAICLLRCDLRAHDNQVGPAGGPRVNTPLLGWVGWGEVGAASRPPKALVCVRRCCTGLRAARISLSPSTASTRGTSCAPSAAASPRRGPTGSGSCWKA